MKINTNNKKLLLQLISAPIIPEVAEEKPVIAAVSNLATKQVAKQVNIYYKK